MSMNVLYHLKSQYTQQVAGTKRQCLTIYPLRLMSYRKVDIIVIHPSFLECIPLGPDEVVDSGRSSSLCCVIQRQPATHKKATADLNHQWRGKKRRCSSFLFTWR